MSDAEKILEQFTAEIPPGSNPPPVANPTSEATPDSLCEFSPEDKAEIANMLAEHIRVTRSRYCPDACFLHPDRWVDVDRPAQPGRDPKPNPGRPRVECSQCGKFIGYRVLAEKTKPKRNQR